MRCYRSLTRNRDLLPSIRYAEEAVPCTSFQTSSKQDVTRSMTSKLESRPAASSTREFARRVPLADRRNWSFDCDIARLSGTRCTKALRCCCFAWLFASGDEELEGLLTPLRDIDLLLSVLRCSNFAFLKTIIKNLIASMMSAKDIEESFYEERWTQFEAEWFDSHLEAVLEDFENAHLTVFATSWSRLSTASFATGFRASCSCCLRRTLSRGRGSSPKSRGSRKRQASPPHSSCSRWAGLLSSSSGFLRSSRTAHAWGTTRLFPCTRQIARTAVQCGNLLLDFQRSQF